MDRPPYRERPFEQRRAEFLKIIASRPEYTAVILERRGRHTPVIDKQKFLVPKSLTCGQFLYVIRKRMSIGREQSLFLLSSSVTLASQELVGDVAAKRADEDGFLYIAYCVENTFG